MFSRWWRYCSGLCLHADSLVDTFQRKAFRGEDGDSTVFQNVGIYLCVHMAPTKYVRSQLKDIVQQLASRRSMVDSQCVGRPS